MASHINQSVAEKEIYSKENESKPNSGLLPSSDTDSEMELSSAVVEGTAPVSGGSSPKTLTNNFDSCLGLTEEQLRSTIEECRASNRYASLRILLRKVFSSETALRSSFLLSQKSVPREKDRSRDKSIDYEIKSLDIKNDAVSKEQLRSAGSDLDKDIDCQEFAGAEDKEMLDIEEESRKENDKILFSSNAVAESTLKVDIESIRRSYDMLYKVPQNEFSSALMDAICQLLRDTLSIQLKVFPNRFKMDTSILNIFIILLENEHITSTEYTEEVLGNMCKVMAQLEVSQQAALVRHISENWETLRVHRFLENLHQLITIRLLNTKFSRDFTINDEDTITSVTCVMKIIYYASICCGELDRPLLVDLPPQSNAPLPENPDHFIGATKEGLGKPPPWDPLGKILGIHPLDSRKPTIPFEEFYDDFLSDQLEMDRDFAYFKAGTDGQFSFLSYPFILTPATKALGLYYDNRIRMYSERRLSIYQTVMEGTPANPYLSLRIRRDHIIEDALVEVDIFMV